MTLPELIEISTAGIEHLFLVTELLPQFLDKEFEVE
jgi:hypothetical protein